MNSCVISEGAYEMANASIIVPVMNCGKYIVLHFTQI